MTFNGRGTSTFPPDDIDNAVLALGIDVEDIDEVTTPAEVATAVATHAALAAAAGTHGRVKQVLADGTDAATNVTVTGIVAADVLISVFALATKAAIATATDRTAEYVPGAGVLTKAAGTNETNNQLLITYIDVA